MKAKLSIMLVWMLIISQVLPAMPIANAAETYTVTYDGNGSTGGTAPTDATNYASGATVTIKAPGTLTKTGHHFAGWNTKADGTGKFYLPDEKLTITESVTLYAQWLYIFAGGGSSSSDNIPATEATLGPVSAMASDSKGNTYIADVTDHKIRKIDANGKISTVAGTGEAGFFGDGALAKDAKLDSPMGLAVDSNDNVYIADSENNRIRKIDVTTGNISTVAGGGSPATGIGDDGLATNAILNQPASIVFDKEGVMYIVEMGHHIIRKVDTSQIITTIAGTPNEGGFAGDGGPATSAKLNMPFRVTVDAQGSIYVVDYMNARIRKIDSSTKNISTVVGNGTYGVPTEGASVTSSISAYDISVDKDGNIYFVEFTFAPGKRIWKVNAQTNTVSIWATASDSSFVTSFTLNGTNGPLIVAVDKNDKGIIYKPSATNAAETYTVTYDGNGSTSGTVPTDTISYTSGDTVTVAAPGTLAKPGFTFAGWNTQADGTGTAYTAGTQFNLSANTTLYAQWTEDTPSSTTYRVMYDKNGAGITGAVPTDDTAYTSGDTVTVLDNTNLTKTGYHFAGWNTQADGKGTAYWPGAELTISENTTLYAQWTEFDFTIENDDTITITGYKGESTEVDIPATINGKSVTAIGDHAFYSAMTGKTLTRVKIPTSVISIGENAFAYNQLTSIDIPTSVTTIGKSAFAENQITSVEIPTSVTTLGDYAFYDNKLTSVKIPTDWTTIGAGVFQDNQLTSVDIPAGVTTIGESAFGINKLTSVEIPAGVTIIGESAFANNKLTGVKIPVGVTIIANSAFAYNELTSVEIPNEVTKIENNAFKSNQLTTVNIPDKVEIIGRYAFADNQLTSVEIPNRVETIGLYAFLKNQLTRVVFKNDTITLEADLEFGGSPFDEQDYEGFEGWYEDEEEKFTMKWLNDGSWWQDEDEWKLKPLTVPASLKLYTKWGLQVKFDSNGGTPVDSAIVKQGTPVTQPSDPEKAGFTFKGWFSDETLKTAYDFSTNVEAGILLYAKWESSNNNNNNNNDGGGGGSNTTPPVNNTNVDVIVNGKTESIGQAQTSTVGNQTQLTLTVDQAKLREKLDKEGNGATVIIPVTNTNADVIVGQLNGQMVKSLEDKQATVVVQTPTASYTLPAAQINIDAISQQIGSNVDLKDIKINIEITKPAEETVKVVEDAAQQGNFVLQVPPVEFKVTYTSGDKSGEVSRFNAYVERTIAIPDGVDPSKITTGIVVDPTDGTTYHVPTKIIQKDGKYYAVINSLTNSLYAVVWHPLQFADVANHWAKDAINNLGSRMVVNGVSEGTFAPNQDITRAQFAAIMVRGLGLKPGIGSNKFNDVTQNAWYADYIATATEYNLITGYTNGNFGPNDKITRQQAFAIIARAMALTDLNTDLSNTEVTKVMSTFKDTNKIATYAKPYVALAVQKGIVNGRSNQTIAPGDSITRAEVAVIIERFLQKSDLINN